VLSPEIFLGGVTGVYAFRSTGRVLLVQVRLNSFSTQGGCILPGWVSVFITAAAGWKIQTLPHHP